MTDRGKRQIERFAPGFRDLVLARHWYFSTGRPMPLSAYSAKLTSAVMPQRIRGSLLVSAMVTV